MADNGTLIIAADPSNGFPTQLSLNITTANFSNGFPEDMAVNCSEPITAMGVDNTRLRVLRKDYKPFLLNIFSARANWTDAVATARLCRTGRGRLMSGLAITMGGVDFLWLNVFVIEVNATPLAATTIGSSIYPASTAAIMSSWNLQFAGF